MFFKKQLLLFFYVIFLNMNLASASTLLVMGDSLSAAYNLRQEVGWVSLLENQLSQSNPEIKVVNASVSGETSQGGLSRFSPLLKQYTPRWIILELGANDALRGYPLTQTSKNIEKMIKLIIKPINKPKFSFIIASSLLSVSPVAKEPNKSCKKKVENT